MLKCIDGFILDFFLFLEFGDFQAICTVHIYAQISAKRLLRRSAPKIKN